MKQERVEHTFLCRHKFFSRYMSNKGESERGAKVEEIDMQPPF